MFARRHAFTLIELLVVISIIALLIALLLPSLGQARSVARTSVCQSNQRQVSISIAAFTTENRDLFPGGNFSDTFSGFLYQGVGQYFPHSVRIADAWVIGDGTSWLVKHNYMTGSSAFKCPQSAGGLFDQLVPYAGAISGMGVYYGFNINAVGDGWDRSTGTNRRWHNFGQAYTSPRKTGQFAQPAQTVLSADRVGVNDVMFNDSIWGAPSLPTPPANIPGPYNAIDVTAAHGANDRAAVMYLDGHGTLEAVWFGNPPSTGNAPTWNQQGYVPSRGNETSWGYVP